MHVIVIDLIHNKLLKLDKIFLCSFSRTISVHEHAYHRQMRSLANQFQHFRSYLALYHTCLQRLKGNDNL